MAFGLIGALAGFALQGASALAGAGAQRKAARANAANALQAYRLNLADLGERAAQAEQATAQEFGGLERQRAAASSTAAASAAESGVAGSSVSALLAKYSMETQAAQGASSASLDNTLSELDRRAEGASVEYQGRLAQVQPPSGLNTALQLAVPALGLLKLGADYGGATRGPVKPSPALRLGNRTQGGY